MAQKPTESRSYGIIRASSGPQKNSPEAQKVRIDELGELLEVSEGVIYKGWFEPDRGVSAKKVRFNSRPAVKMLLERIRPGDYMLISHYDRVCRTHHDASQISDMVRLSKIHVRSTDSPDVDLFTFDTMSDFFQTTIASIEGLMASQRIKASFEVLKSQGRPYHGKPKYGYKNVAVGHHPNGRYIKDWQWCQREWDLIHEIVQRRARGHTYSEVMRDFRERKEKTADNRSWGKTIDRFQSVAAEFERALTENEIEIINGYVVPGKNSCQRLKERAAEIANDRTGRRLESILKEPDSVASDPA